LHPCRGLFSFCSQPGVSLRSTPGYHLLAPAGASSENIGIQI
jgi:hypothetical protein